MDRITALLKFQWRAYWRRFHSAGTITTSNVGVLILVGGLGLLRYLQQLPLAANQIAKGETTRYEMLLIIAFLAWMVPVMAESKRSISSDDLLHFPLSVSDLFLLRVGSVFCSPVTWITIAVTLTLSYPVALAQHPLPGILALLTLLFCGFFTSLAITHVLQSSLARKLSFAVLLAGSVVGGLVWLAGTQSQFLTAMNWLLPHRLAAAAAVSATPLRWFAMLVVVTAFAAVLARWTFMLTLEPQQTRRSQKFALLAWPQLPGKFGGLLRKDLRYSTRLLDLYLALPVVVLFDIYLAVNVAPAAPVLFVMMAALFLPCASLVFNCFGLDSPLGLDRYTLFPLSEKEKLFSKNLAYWTIMFALFLTILPFALWSLEAKASAIALLEFVAMGLAYAAIGNWMSVKQPFKMQFYRFASGGSAVDVVMGMIFASIPAALTLFLSWKVGIIVAVYLAIYLLALARAARILNDQREQIRRALS